MPGAVTALTDTRRGTNPVSVPLGGPGTAFRGPVGAVGLHRRNGEQNRASFYLTGHQMATGFADLEGLGLRSAHFAAYRQLHEIRYDFPLVLADGRDAGDTLRSLSALVDDLLAKVAVGDDADRIRHHAMQLEREIRVRADQGVARLSTVWRECARALSSDGDDLLRNSLDRLTAALTTDGALLACTAQVPRQVVGHVWEVVQRARKTRLADRIARLRQGLEDILAAERANSRAGLAGDQLAHSLGPVFGAELDVDALSKLLTDNRPRALLTDERRERVQRLLDVLTRQRFVACDGLPGTDPSELYSFVYDKPGDAITAYRDRFAATTELAKVLVMAEMEADGRYREEVHDALFEKWDVVDLEAEILGMFPEYLVRVDAEAMTAQDSVALLEALAAGIPIKALVQVNDLLGGSSSVDRAPGSGLAARKLARYALASGEPFVLQSTSAGLYQVRDQLVAGSMAPGSALFVVYSGGGQWLGDLPPYLASAAATEARVFPSFCYDPSAGDTWLERFSLTGNPQPERRWTMHRLSYEDASLQRVSVEQPFTAADFWAGDVRMLPHLALASSDGTEGAVVPFAQHFASDPGVWADELPYLLMVSSDDRLHRVFVDRPLVHRAQRDVEQWGRIQQLGGLHITRTVRELVRQREALEKELEQARAGQTGAPVAAGGAGGTTGAAVAATPPAAGAAAPPTAGAAPVEDAATAEPGARDPYQPWIETARCSTCNECTLINDQMFAYNENRQAYIADADAGTYAELVEAAENCQVSIIHPGKPRNPAEPGLEELIKRAEAFS